MYMSISFSFTPDFDLVARVAGHDFILDFLQQTLLLGVGICSCTSSCAMSGQPTSGGVCSGQTRSGGVISGQTDSGGVRASQTTSAGVRSGQTSSGGSGPVGINFLVQDSSVTSVQLLPVETCGQAFAGVGVVVDGSLTVPANSEKERFKIYRLTPFWTSTMCRICNIVLCTCTLSKHLFQKLILMGRSKYKS
jgi:hypothetical protein